MTAPKTLAAELTRPEASQILIDAIPKDCGIRGMTCTIDEQDDVIIWTAVVFDALLPGGEDAIGTVQFSEHWPVVDITWTPGGAV